MWRALSVSSYPALHVRYNLCNTYVSNKYTEHLLIGGVGGFLVHGGLTLALTVASKTKLSTAY